MAWSIARIIFLNRVYQHYVFSPLYMAWSIARIIFLNRVYQHYVFSPLYLSVGTWLGRRSVVTGRLDMIGKFSSVSLVT
jgi:mannitol-specific phosphotransferase system IIBC component